jgi:hypothetical protein
MLQSGHPPNDWDRLIGESAPVSERLISQATSCKIGAGLIGAMEATKYVMDCCNTDLHPLYILIHQTFLWVNEPMACSGAGWDAIPASTLAMLGLHPSLRIDVIADTAR